MTVLIIILLACSVVLFLLSFMQKGNSKQIESEMEEIASQLMQENFELKKTCVYSRKYIENRC
ncbi:hypothetical protein PCORN_07495 [Listeria cornellensis FSL F6-0969]|uniref:Uncharacterized protein n=1 Tax=Listeria cornellensis FSL F6-0969 TaxID=1265820 RepID=W7C0W2_9LIST|nr:hypothetical protein PCORN_07495 [Listeria cornellensis FSL F6-0969]